MTEQVAPIPRTATDASLVFLVGSPRTGSTILRHVLKRSPRICVASETHFMRSSERLRLRERAQRIAAGDDRELESVVSDMLRDPFWVFVRRNASHDELRERIKRGEPSERGLFVGLLDLYVEKQHGWSEGLVVGEKSPEHLGYVPRLLEWFPDARIIHTIRDPRAVYASSVRRAREGRWGLKTYARAAPGWLVDRLVDPVELVRTGLVWRRAARLDVEYGRLLGDRYHRIRYEDLVRAPETELRRVCAFLGVEYSDELLADVRVVGSSFQAERHGPSGIQAGSAERWREEVPAWSRRWLELTNERQMRRLGYLPPRA